MLQGRSIVDLAKELERQQATKKDYLADTRYLEMMPQGSDILMVADQAGAFSVNPIAHAQLAEQLNIPKPYYDRMLSESPDLLASNVNHWMQAKPATRLLRTVDSRLRAVLSDRYRCLDNYDLVAAALPAIQKAKARIVSCEVTERKLYIKAVTSEVKIEVRKGDIVEAGILITNSEVGYGRISVAPFLLRLVCINGMVANDHSLKKTHVGRSAGEEFNGLPEEWLRDETREADDRAFFMKVSDIVAGSFEQQRFAQIAQSLVASTERQIEADPQKVVEVTRKAHQLTEGERGDVMRFLIQGGDLSQYGLAQAVTRAASESKDYDRSTELELVGGRLIEMETPDWNRLMKEAA